MSLNERESTFLIFRHSATFPGKFLIILTHLCTLSYHCHDFTLAYLSNLVATICLYYCSILCSTHLMQEIGSVLSWRHCREFSPFFSNCSFIQSFYLASKPTNFRNILHNQANSFAFHCSSFTHKLHLCLPQYYPFAVFVGSFVVFHAQFIACLPVGKCAL